MDGARASLLALRQGIAGALAGTQMSGMEFEGMLAALAMMGRPVGTGPSVPVPSGMTRETFDRLSELAVLLHEEITRLMDRDASLCVPPACSQDRLDWCRGFVLSITEPPASTEHDLTAQSVIVNMAVLAGELPFEEVEFTGGKKTETEWRAQLEAGLPRMFRYLCTEVRARGPG